MKDPKTLFAIKFLRWFCHRDLIEDVEGDLLELYQENVGSFGKSKSNWKLLLEVLKLFRPGIIKNIRIERKFNRIAMIKNYLITAVRFAGRYRGYTIINLLGLVVGLAATMQILLWINDEINIDKFHANSDNIYRVWRNMYQSSGEINTTSSVPQPFQTVLNNEYPEIDKVALFSWEMEFSFLYNDVISYEKGRYASPEFFKIFSFPFLEGNPENVLNDVSSIVISESLALKYFGERWKEDGLAIGNSFEIDNRARFKVTGVFADPGPTSSLDFDWIIAADEYIQRNEWVQSWYNGGFSIFFNLNEGAEISVVQERSEQEINKHTNNEADERIYIQPFDESYLHSTFKNGLPVGGRIEYVRILSIVAAFILFVACINFMNLATARSGRRAREIGIRKVMGAKKGGLKTQFFLESYLLTICSALIAILVVIVTLPYFNAITGKSLQLFPGTVNVWVGLGIVLIVTGLLSGSYPALLLSSFKVTDSLKGTIPRSKGGIFFRQGLVVVQFTISLALIIGTIVVNQQMQYILNKNLGLDKENLVLVEMEQNLIDQIEVYKTELNRLPEVASVTTSSGNPISYGRSTGGAEWEGKDPSENVEINVLSVDQGFISTMRMEILDGRDFSTELLTDTVNYIVNEVAADIMGFQEPINKQLSVWGQPGKIIGVVRNFHMNSMFEPIAPLIIRYDPGSTFISIIRTQGDVSKALQGIESVTQSLNPKYPLKYSFLDKEFEATYTNEMTLSTLTKIFALVSIFISCLGLIGLSSFSTNQRSREIGIRKVHGASVINLVMMLSRDYAKLMIIAFVIAVPISYYFMQEWLNDFVFRTEINPSVFLLAGIAVFVVGSLAVGYKSYEAATINPAKTLKDE